MSPEYLISKLAKQAAKAIPIWPKRKPGPKGKWAPLFPIYDELRKKGFTILEAIDWMVREGAIEDEDRDAAYWGLPMVAGRRKRDALRAQGLPLPPKRKRPRKSRRA